MIQYLGTLEIVKDELKLNNVTFGISIIFCVLDAEIKILYLLISHFTSRY